MERGILKQIKKSTDNGILFDFDNLDMMLRCKEIIKNWILTHSNYYICSEDHNSKTIIVCKNKLQCIR